MSLNYDLTKIKDFKQLYVCEENEQEETQLDSTTERIIFLAMEVDLGEITEKNVDEWLVRLEMMRMVGWAPRTPITRADIERHIGLRTNVAPKSRSQYKTKLAKHIEREAEDAVKRAKRNTAQAA
jgi:hypothetical protein